MAFLKEQGVKSQFLWGQNNSLSLSSIPLILSEPPPDWLHQLQVLPASGPPPGLEGHITP